MRYGTSFPPFAVTARSGRRGRGSDPRPPPNAVSAARKISKQAVAYQDHPDGDKRCDKCVQFQPPHACKLVDGTINPAGSRRIFVPMRPSRGARLRYPRLLGTHTTE